MILIISNGNVIATHSDDQPISQSMYPGCEIVSYSGVISLSSDATPDPRTDSQKSKAYRDKRKMAYMDIGDQLDMMYWDMVNGTKVWQYYVSGIKEKYPK